MCWNDCSGSQNHVQGTRVVMCHSKSSHFSNWTGIMTVLQRIKEDDLNETCSFEVMKDIQTIMCQLKVHS